MRRFGKNCGDENRFHFSAAVETLLTTNPGLVYAKDNQGMTLLSWTVKRHPEVVEWLRQHGGQ